jgi:outer membrane protein assembly factor BamB
MKCHLRLPAVGGLILSCVIAAGAGADWPQWRGPNRDGHSPDVGLLKHWPEAGPKLLWTASGLGSGYASVSAAGDRLFAMGDRGEANYLICLRCADGHELWAAKVGKSGAPGRGGFAGPRCTPTVGDTRVIAVGQYGEVLCADAASGAEIWRKDCAKDFGGTMPEWGFCGMPLVDGQNVILAPGGKQGDLVALNKETGNLIWRSKELTDSLHYTSPILVEIGGVRQIVLLTTASVAGIRASDGGLLWRAARKVRSVVAPTPIYRDGRIYVCSGWGAGCNLFKITANNGGFSAAQTYANKVMSSQHGGVVLVDKHLYGFSEGKGWTCQDFRTGSVVWQQHGIGPGSLVYADGLLYLRAESDKGTVAIIEASADGYKELGRFDPPDRSDKNSWSHPVVTGGRLYLRDQDVLQCYEVLAK